MRTTTLAKIRAKYPCDHSWRTLLLGLGRSGPGDESLPYARIFEINGFFDALWAMRTEEDFRWVQKLAFEYCKHVQDLLVDLHPMGHPNKKSVALIDLSERHLAGQTTAEELRAAQEKWVPGAAWCASLSFRAVTSTSADAVSDTIHELSHAAVAEAGERIRWRSIYDVFVARDRERKWQEEEFLRVVS